MAKKKKSTKIFVLDTSVILHDNTCIHSFAGNDVVIPISVLEELDNFKKGHESKNFEAREFARKLDALSENSLISDWTNLGESHGDLKVEMNEVSEPNACKIFGENKADHRILNVAIRMQNKHPKRSVILVSKDINLRIKAKSLKIIAQDYLKGRVMDEAATFKGRSEIELQDDSIIDKIYNDGGIPYSAIFDEKPLANHYYILKKGSSSALAYFNPDSEQIERVEKRSAYGIKPKNAEQVFAMHAVLDSKIKLVTISGVAGTGKTLLALSSALENRSQYKQIFLARPIVPLSNRDIGYLPGDVTSKLDPYMQPLWDNLKFIKSQFKETDKDVTNITQMLEQEKILITPLAYIRGRSLSNVIFIVDEAQNLTPHEIKTIITRAGENTKIIFTGDINQIDSPYLDKLSNGLSYVIDKIKDHPLHAHITLERGERSELANVANELL